MNLAVFDIEADGLNPTKIHCISVWDGKKIKSTSKYENMKKFFLGSEVLIGHNISRYDIPAVEKLLDIDLSDKKFVDTLALSWYIYTTRVKHGLEDWGEEFGYPKVAIDDWENLSTAEYIERCHRDVEINTILWDKQWKFLKRLYGNEEDAWRCIDYLQFKMDCAALQEHDRWKLDKKKCQAGIDDLAPRLEKKNEELAAIMPDVPKYVTKRKPAKPYKQDGTLSVHGQRWFDLLKAEGLPTDTEQCRVVGSYEPPKPTSPQQLKDLLFSFGWKPDEFKYERNEDKSLRKIPQINTQVPGENGLTESVKRVIEKHPELAPIDEKTVIKHRLDILQTFMDNVDEEGYVQAQMQGLTNTLRYKHKVCLNLPGVQNPYGELIRGCLTAPKGYELCGSDKSSLEDKVKQHFLFKHDPEYVAEMQQPGYDPHIALAVYNKAITPEQHEAYNNDDPKVKPLVKGIRRAYKTTNYACQYGASGWKVALSAGIPTKEGENLHEAYWKKNWAIKAVAEEIQTKKCGDSMWLFNPVSKLWYSLRHKKDIFSTLCQGTGVYCFDTWIKHILKRRKQLTAQFHDEIVLCIRQGFRKPCKALLKKALKDTNNELQLNVKLEIDVQFGDNYAQIH